jgi:hypothetical protein
MVERASDLSLSSFDEALSPSALVTGRVMHKRKAMAKFSFIHIFYHKKKTNKIKEIRP